MSEQEIDAEVFKVIRANQEMPKKKLMKTIKEHLPECSERQIVDSLIRLIG